MSLLFCLGVACPQSLFPHVGVCFASQATLAVRIIAAVSQDDTWSSKGSNAWSRDVPVLMTTASCETKGLAKAFLVSAERMRVPGCPHPAPPPHLS